MTIHDFLRAKPTRVWLVLVAITVVSVVTAGGHGSGSRIGLVALVLATVKARFVGLDFMELRHAPRLLRTLFELYCVAIAGTLVVVYLVA
ncbi:MAG TPA: cytochrome C oxidase subunit IV family protein [Marmoricola sp.]|jgi:caa(3)-type oxidase subunit IV|nr:cytochrome C oxidase subunit IV family protein [Marmoricola sp.]